MRPRMYGSSESHRFFTSTSPSRASGSGEDSSRKFASVTQPCGRLASTMRWFCTLELGEAREMVVGVAELAREHSEPAESVADLQLVAHAPAAVRLHRLLADVARRVGDLDLRRRDRARIGAGIGPARREAGHGARLLERDEHVDDAVLQRLEGADRHAELLARLEILERSVAGELHRAHRLGADERGATTRELR